MFSVLGFSTEARLFKSLSHLKTLRCFRSSYQKRSLGLGWQLSGGVLRKQIQSSASTLCQKQELKHPSTCCTGPVLDTVARGSKTGTAPDLVQFRPYDHGSSFRKKKKQRTKLSEAQNSVLYCPSTCLLLTGNFLIEPFFLI